VSTYSSSAGLSGSIVKPPPPIAKIVGTRPARRAPGEQPCSNADACRARRAPVMRSSPGVAAAGSRRAPASGGKRRRHVLRRSEELDGQRQLDDLVADRFDAVGARLGP
jgi:hypothetical protein